MTPGGAGLRVALVGLGFGAEFAAIYLHHPQVRSLAICDSDERVLQEVGSKFGIPERCSDLRAVLDSPEIDAVHLVTPIPLHARQSVAVLEAGKHCACTVPMATSLEDLRTVLRAQRSSKKTFMMMETAAYTREFLFVQEMARRGELGRIQMLRGAHYQDMENWPPYWEGLPPMHYATHAVAPLLLLAGTRASAVHCFGSAWMREELRRRYGNPFPAETAIFRLEGCEAAMEVTRTLFHTARAYTESFHVYGEKASFEWQQIEEEDPVVFRMEPAGKAAADTDARRGRRVFAERVQPPDRQDLLPEEIRRFTRRGYYDKENPHLSFLQGGGHGGSHPHLVHAFLSAVVEGKPPLLDAVTSADITAAGICAHVSAMKNGERVDIPGFDAQECGSHG